MALDLYLGFVAATIVLVLTPGPVVALIVANSTRYGPARGVFTVAGSTSALVVHLALVCVGLSALLAAAGEALFWLKWLGAAYLFWLGLRAFFAPAPAPGEAAPAKSLRRLFVEAFAVAFANPKSLLFYGAFFPLFIAADRPLGPQLLLLSATFLVVAATLDLCWALAAGRARPLLLRAGRWMNRLTGGVLILAAIGLLSLRKG